MPFRSTAIFATDKKILANAMLKKNYPALLEEAEKKEAKVAEGTLYFIWESYTWHDTLTEIKEFMKFIHELPDEDFGLMVMGEDGSIEHQLGDYWDYGLETHQYIGTPFGDIA